MASVKAATFSPDDFVWKGVTLTDSAAKQILSLVAQDLQFTHNGATLYVPLQAMPFIDGTEVDYVREGLNQIFKFNNPKAQHACGCGESFGVE